MPEGRVCCPCASIKKSSLTVSIARLDLDKWIYDPPSDSEDEFKGNDLTFMMSSGGGAGGNDQFATPRTGRSKKGKKKKGKKEMGEEESEDEEEMERVCHSRRLKQYILPQKTMLCTERVWVEG